MEKSDIPIQDYERLREIWGSMRKRCYNRACKDYPHYGARGIKMCDEWKDDFFAFAEWALTHGYRADLTVDRFNCNRGYGPDNCRWASVREQAYNRSTNRRVCAFGKVRTLEEWSAETGITADRIAKRLKAGWTPEEAVGTPVRPYRKGDGKSSN